MEMIPKEVRAYLSTNDSLVRARLQQQYPELDKVLNEAKTRTAVLNWLATDEAWAGTAAHFTMNCLRYLQGKASQDEAPTIRAFLLHALPDVRRAAYEYLLALYYPDKNREALLQLLQNMLSDTDEAVRAEGARYVKQSGAAPDLKRFLQRWYEVARDQGQSDSESFELVGRLLEG
jgi:hypothetical protein